MLYQCLEVVGCYLLAARGSCIDVINICDFSVQSTWTLPHVGTQQDEHNSEKRGSKQLPELPPIEVNSTCSPPIKKRKILASENSGEDLTSKKSEVVESNKQTDHPSKEIPAISSLAATKNGKFVVAVTGEDKSIRVLGVVHDNQVCKLIEQSIRRMPKRPCAIVITNDDETIVCADKFGDVYSIPLLHSTPITDNTFSKPSEKIAKPFVPAANEFTIHSQRNRKTLESQKKQTNQPSQKPELNFEHKLLLGHVSMLTDIKLAFLSGRNYIITSDRDEHIRISRGIPQTHVIENFCLGHSEFVSRLCIPHTKPSILVSGGGDDDLYVWDWNFGTLLSKINLIEHVTMVKKRLNLVPNDDTLTPRMKLAVSGIQHTCAVTDHEYVDLIVVTCESVPAFFTFILSPENVLQYVETVYTSGNVLDMCFISNSKDSGKELAVSVDNYRKPGSSSEPRNSVSLDSAAINRFELRGKTFYNQTIDIKMPAGASVETSYCMRSCLLNLLYNIENLRKRDDFSE
ncbi:tRNA (guanine-N(7)-)-methyltransferase non-catalytic subunit [Podosphaera aphanis]|nr:tRNA (guanine-N(7)-)-methyltransferase non-catalytic subunit [Podosphaera aphanis]